jgi:hypothetical protein
VFSEPICIWIFVIFKLFSAAIFLIFKISSCHIQKDDVLPHVEIALKAHDHIQGFILIQISNHGLPNFAISCNCFKLVATIKTHMSTNFAKFFGVSWPDI